MIPFSISAGSFLHLLTHRLQDETGSAHLKGVDCDLMIRCFCFQASSRQGCVCNHKIG